MGANQNSSRNLAYIPKSTQIHSTKPSNVIGLVKRNQNRGGSVLALRSTSHGTPLKIETGVLFVGGRKSMTGLMLCRASERHRPSGGAPARRNGQTEYARRRRGSVHNVRTHEAKTREETVKLSASGSAKTRVTTSGHTRTKVRWDKAWLRAARDTAEPGGAENGARLRLYRRAMA
jgi:hypothetical protein